MRAARRHGGRRDPFGELDYTKPDTLRSARFHEHAGADDVATNVPLQISGALTVGQVPADLDELTIASAGVRIDHGGAINLTNSLLKETGFGFFDVVNGSALLDSGLIDCGANPGGEAGKD